MDTTLKSYSHLNVLYNIRYIAVLPIDNNPILKNTVFALTPQRWAPNAIHEILYLKKILMCTFYLIPHKNTSQMIPRVSNPPKELKSYHNLNIKFYMIFENLINNNSKKACEILPKLIQYNHLNVLYNIGYIAVLP